MGKNDGKCLNTWQLAADKLVEDLFLRVIMKSTYPNEKGKRNVTID